MYAYLRLATLSLCAAVALHAAPAWADLTIGNYTLVSSQRVSRTDFEYTYRVDVTNTGAAVEGVTATVTSTAGSTAIVDGEVSFGGVFAGATVTSSDTFTIRQNRTSAFNPGALAWTVKSTPVVGNLISISGVATDDPLAGATVTVRSFDGRVLATTTTGADGQFLVQVPAAEVASGYDLVAAGGMIGTEPFVGTLRAIYSASDDPATANLTLVTTLVAALADQSPGGTVLERRDLVIQTLAEIGVVHANDWHSLNPVNVDMRELHSTVVGLGLATWLEQMVTDLSDSDLSPENMPPFPHAHGGILSVGFASGAASEAFKGVEFAKQLSVQGPSGAAYSWELLEGPAGMAADTDGRILYAVADDASTGMHGFRVKVSNGDGYRFFSGSIYVMDTDIIATGTIGPAGGVISDDWEETVLTVPEAAVSADAVVDILKGTQADARFSYTIRSSMPFLNSAFLHTPDVGIRELELQQQGSTAGQVAAVVAGAQALASGMEMKVWGERYARTLEFTTGINRENRLRTGLGQVGVIQDVINLNQRKAAELRSFCEGPATFAAGHACYDKDPVLFVHGYTIWGGLGGGTDTWGVFPEQLQQKGYAVFEFKWSTAARFGDAAADLAAVVAMITEATGRKVHIVAHSFGGLLSRAYLQGLAVTGLNKDGSDQVFPFQGDIADLITLGTPHSGIFPDAGKHGSEWDFPMGQDAKDFRGCLQISCQEAGAPAPGSYLVMSNGVTYPYDEKFGIETNPGGFIRAITDTNSRPLPVPVDVLIGLTVDRVFFGSDKYEKGDALISFEGQRFHPGLVNTLTSDEPLTAYGADVYETILGFPHGARPGADLPENLRGEEFEGYRHTNNLTLLGDAREANVPPKKTECPAEVSDPANRTDDDHKQCHDSLARTNDWLDRHPSTQVDSRLFGVNVQAVDAGTGQPVVGALISLGVDRPRWQGTTDFQGRVTVNMPFIPNQHYKAWVAAVGYHGDVYDTGYRTQANITETSPEFGRIALQPAFPARGSLVGTITDAVDGAALAGVLYEVSKDGVLKASAMTNVNGGYVVDGLMRGTYLVTLVKDGYVGKTFSVDVNADMINVGNASMRPVLPAGALSIVLEWGLNPRDLDSHLVKYDQDGIQQYHLAYYDKRDATTGDNLDHDDTTSYGPETTTIQSVDPMARYVFAIHHYAGSGSITTTSNATVTVTYGDRAPVVFRVPNSGDGIWWKVFEINNGNVEPCQAECMAGSQGLALNSLSESSTRFTDWLRDMTESLPTK